MVAPEVKVVGLPELRSALRKVESGLPKELSEVGKEVGRFVAEKARARAYSLGSVAAKSGPSVRAAAAAGGGAVRIGGGSYPYALGAEFGGGRRPTTQQFQPWRGSGSGAGYFLYPSIRDNADQIEQQWVEGVEDLLKRAGLA